MPEFEITPKKISSYAKEHWKLLLLVFIFFISYSVRLPTAGSAHLQTYDPSLFQRYTEYIINNGSLPKWDEFSYYPPGRPLNYPPLMFYMSAYLYKLYNLISPTTIVEFLKYLAAIYGAISVFPAYMLGKEFGDRNTGLLAALFVGISPAILTRTMAAFYDTDSIVVFFSLVSMYLIVRSLRKAHEIFKENQFDNHFHAAIKKNSMYFIAAIAAILFIGFLIPAFSQQFFPIASILNIAFALAFAFFFWKTLGKMAKELAIGALGLVIFSFAWPDSWYIPIIVGGGGLVYFLALWFFGDPSWVHGKRETMPSFSERFPMAFTSSMWFSVSVFLIFITALAAMTVFGYTPVKDVLFLFKFTRNVASDLIVNISVAELQPLNVFGNAWDQLFQQVNVPILFMLGGSLLLLRRNRLNGSILFIWNAVTFYSIITGIRFMVVFAPAAALGAAVYLSEAYRAIKEYGSYAPLIALSLYVAVIWGLSKVVTSVSVLMLLGILMAVAGKQSLLEKAKKSTAIAAAAFLAPLLTFMLLYLILPNKFEALILTSFFGILLFFVKTEETQGETAKISTAAALASALLACIIIVSISAATTLSFGSGDLLDGNWNQAYTWLKDNTAKDSVVGSWWDPGHDIANYAKRRNIADGAHCPDGACTPGLNTRITHLGKIFCTTNEDEAFTLLTKYRGDASEMYWIASDDLVGKFRWLQYFGCACDGTGQYTKDGQQKCPLYSQLPAQNAGYDQQGNIGIYYYAGGPILVKQNDRWVAAYRDGNNTFIFKKQVIFSDAGVPQVFDYTGQNNTLPSGGTVWVHPSKGYMVYIPPQLESALFTRMFFYQEPETKHFELAYNSGNIKIYKAKLQTAGE